MTSLIHPKYASFLYTSAGVTAAAACALFSRYETVKIIAQTTLMGVGFATSSNMFGCRTCIDYFIMAHAPDKKTPELARLIRNKKPTINALVWGIFTASIPSGVAGFVFAVAARIPFSKFSSQITARQLLPYTAGITLLTLIVAEVRARIAGLKLNDKSLDLEERRKHEDVLLLMQPAWETCRVRVSTSKKCLIAASFGLVTAMVLSRLNLIKLWRP